MVDYEIRGRVAVLKINRPEKKNAVNGDVARGMEAAIDKLEADPDVWLGVLTGEGNVFCAGADLKAINEGKAGELSRPSGAASAASPAAQRTKPIIAAVDGPGPRRRHRDRAELRPGRGQHAGHLRHPRGEALAGGRRPAACSACPRLLPRNIALELGLTGDPITAERAYHFGLVNELCEPGQALEAGPGAGRADRRQRADRRARDAAPHDRAARRRRRDRRSASRARR